MNVLRTIQYIKFLCRIKWILLYERHLKYAQYLDPTAWIVDMFQFGGARESRARHSGACHTWNVICSKFNTSDCHHTPRDWNRNYQPACYSNRRKRWQRVADRSQRGLAWVTETLGATNVFIITMYVYLLHSLEVVLQSIVAIRSYKNWHGLQRTWLLRIYTRVQGTSLSSFL